MKLFARRRSSPRRTPRALLGLIVGAAVTGAALAGAAPARAVVAAETTEAERAVLTQAEDYMTRIKTMQARFLQVAQNGGYAEGTVLMKRPGKMRLQYDPPARMLIVADGTWLIYVDEELKQVNHIPLGRTPAGILLRDDISFADEDVIVTDVRRDAGVAEIDVKMADDPAAGTLTLVFSEEPFALRQWRMTDAQGAVTKVSLFDVRTGLKFNPANFVYTDNPHLGNQ